MKEDTKKVSYQTWSVHAFEEILESHIDPFVSRESMSHFEF
jgi:hypothetical protein